MLYCQSPPTNHRAPAAYALTFARRCGHESSVRSLACLDHGGLLRGRPRTAGASRCERCGESSPLVLVRIEDVYEQQVVVAFTLDHLQTSPLSQATLAYDQACRAASGRGLQPVTAYRAPVQWSPSPRRSAGGSEVMEAQVTMAVTLPEGISLG